MATTKESKRERKKEIEVMLSGVENIREAGEVLFKKYNSVLDDIVSVIDSDFVSSKVDHIKKLGEELEGLLKQMRGEEEKKSKGLLALFSNKALDLISFDGTIQHKVNKVMNSYKESYDNIAKAVEMQMDKGKCIMENIGYFQEIEEYLTEKLSKLKNETFNERVLVEEADAFIKNISKMVIFLKQKKVILEQALINSISLRGQMAAGMTHFESMIKDILISASIDNVVKTGANIMNMFRDIIEKYSEYQVKDTIETAHKVSEIRKNGALSIKSLQNVQQMIGEAGKSYKALAVSQNQSSKTLEKELEGLEKDLDKASDGQIDYLTATVLPLKS